MGRVGVIGEDPLRLLQEIGDGHTRPPITNDQTTLASLEASYQNRHWKDGPIVFNDSQVKKAINNALSHAHPGRNMGIPPFLRSSTSYPPHYAGDPLKGKASTRFTFPFVRTSAPIGKWRTRSSFRGNYDRTGGSLRKEDVAAHRY
jgi:hypothetical protein